MIVIDKMTLKTILALSLDTETEIDVAIERIQKEAISDQEVYNRLQRKFKLPRTEDEVNQYMYLGEKL